MIVMFSFYFIFSSLFFHLALSYPFSFFVFFFRFRFRFSLVFFLTHLVSGLFGPNLLLLLICIPTELNYCVQCMVLSNLLRLI